MKAGVHVVKCLIPKHVKRSIEPAISEDALCTITLLVNTWNTQWSTTKVWVHVKACARLCTQHIRKLQ